LDGGMGQELVNRSSQPPHADWGDWVMRKEPHLVQALHEEYLRAGARVITLNTYLTTPRTCTDADGNPDRADFEATQGSAIELAHAARKAVRPEALVAGSLPPLAWSYLPDLVEAFEKNVADYSEIVTLNAPHVDLFICETMSTSEEARAAATAATGSAKPVWVSWTLSDELGPDGKVRLRSGETVAEALTALEGLPIAAHLFNCCLPEIVLAGLPEFASTGKPCGTYPNAFEPITAAYAPGTTTEEIGNRADLTPKIYADRAMGWIDAGASIVGGCCQTDPSHIAEVARRFEAEGHSLVPSV
ncbi:MAG: homocysteine S-methyltransferase family protein, partial [Paracoccaceae bacterium]